MSVAFASAARAEMASQIVSRPSPQYQLPLSWVGQTLRRAALDGLDVTGPFSTLAVGFSGDADEDRGLDPMECMLLCLSLVNSVDDELHGLTRSRMSRGTASMGARASASSTTLEGAITTLCRFYDMIGAHCRFALYRMSGGAVVTISTEPGDEQHRALIEELLAHTVHMHLSYFFGAFLPLTRFITSSSFHPAIDRQHPYLLCPVVAGKTSSLVFPVELLVARSRAVSVDHPLWEAARFWLARHPATMPPICEGDSERPATSALLSVLKQDDLPIADCSEELALTVQDLRRYLADEGTNFRQIRRAALVERARPHLIEGSSADDLAAALGYSDARSFRRALKVATGLGIADLRRDVRTAAPDRTLVMQSLHREMMRLE